MAEQQLPSEPALEIQIRPETPSDAQAIHALLTAAFPTPAEAHLVETLRKTAAYIPSLALVAVQDSTVVGHIMLTRAHVDNTPALGLAPLAVLPEYRSQGVGSALVRAALHLARDETVGVLGDTGYYGRFGFRLAAEVGIEPPVAGWAPHFMVLRAGPAKGVFRYHEAFDGV